MDCNMLLITDSLRQQLLLTMYSRGGASTQYITWGCSLPTEENNN